MKSKLIFIIILLSLFLSISHDILLTNETTECECTYTLKSMQESENIDCCKGMCELHEIFHYSAILSTIDIIFHYHQQIKLLFISSTPQSTIYQSTFRPPIS